MAALLSADTSVVLDGRILGKPDNDGHARQMLALLSMIKLQEWVSASFIKLAYLKLILI